MIARILISPRLTSRTETVNKILQEFHIISPHPDLLYFEDDQKLGIEQAKKIKEHLKTKPFSAKFKIVAAQSAQNFTTEAQNSLLKTLEEPPGETIFILGCDKESSILPTVLSRCQVEYLHDQSNIVDSQLLLHVQKLSNLTIPERFEYIEKLENKEEFLQALINYYQKKLPDNLEFAKKLLDAEEWVRSNVNIRAILEYLMLNIPEDPN